MKRIFFFTLAVLLAFVFAACGEDNDTGGVSSSESSAVSSASSGGSVTSAMQNATPLAVGGWVSGLIEDDGGEQWFRFTATATTQYVHFADGGTWDIYLQLYNSDGSPRGTELNLRYNSNPMHDSWSGLSISTEYFIRVRAKEDSEYYNFGSYEIGLTASAMLPTATLPNASDIIQLTMDVQYENGEIASAGGRQWFSFEATAASHQIFFVPGTLDDILVRVYDSLGVQIGDRENLYALSYGDPGSNYAEWSGFTATQTYYIEVWPYWPDEYGTYMITVIE